MYFDKYEDRALREAPAEWHQPVSQIIRTLVREGLRMEPHEHNPFYNAEAAEAADAYTQRVVDAYDAAEGRPVQRMKLVAAELGISMSRLYKLRKRAKLRGIEPSHTSE